jgi:Glyoxalase-like domain
MEESQSSAGAASGIPAYVIVDSQDPDRITPFWCGLLGVEVLEYRDGGHVVALGPAPSLPGSMMLVLQRVPEAKVGKNRVHVDMFVSDLDVGTARVECCGPGPLDRLIDYHAAT